MATSVLWFRKGLRLHDNPALLAAMQNAKYLVPTFVLDPRFLDPSRVGVNRMRFLLESLQDLDRSLKKLGSRLVILQGDPTKILPALFSELGVSKLAFEQDTEPYAKLRDKAMKETAKEMGIEVCDPISHTLYDMESLYQSNGKKLCTSYRSFITLCHKQGPPAKPASTPPFAMKLPPIPDAYQDSKKYNVPNLQEIGYPEAEQPSLFPGGETEAIVRMENYLADKARVATFAKPNTSPAAFDPPATTVLSPYLKFGCLSPRYFYYRLLDIYTSYRGKKTEPPVSLIGQVMWREFFYYNGYSVPNFSQMKENPICIQIDWGKDSNSEALFEAWKNGETGYPWIDAIMKQLHQEGWMHHLARHSVACFLTRGDLWVSWEKGAQVFDRLLLDADWSLNNGNWMWLSASSFFYQYFRVYSPIAFGKKWDPEGQLIRKFIPQLKDFPAKYIYEPWKAPKSVQEQCGCIIGKDYPLPIVDHDAFKDRNIARMKVSYEQHRLAKGALAPDGPSDSDEEASAPSAPAPASRGEKGPSRGGKAAAEPQASKRGRGRSGPISKFFSNE
eukprot:TRINITY_DN7745_c0_g1_i2.p1 TRINITY_DN7745_c0_g1~~TRINITY_DN7745_c0_g1_i2.p1  ORF type:complete len:559 (+),score=102.83 TRINITY_DN7745_c0_g1_i2:62-1738(+)